MASFKEIAELRTEALKRLLSEIEQLRDKTLDELAEKKGRAAELEWLIARLYQMILDINKEEQQREILQLAELAKKELQEKEAARKKSELEAFEVAKRGVKTPKPPRRQRDK